MRGIEKKWKCNDEKRGWKERKEGRDEEVAK